MKKKLDEKFYAIDCCNEVAWMMYHFGLFNKFEDYLYFKSKLFGYWVQRK